MFNDFFVNKRKQKVSCTKKTEKAKSNKEPKLSIKDEPEGMGEFDLVRKIIKIKG